MTISATHDIVVLLGLRNEIVGALVTIFTGALVGFVVAQFYGPFCARYGPFGTHPNLNPDGEPENSSVWCIRHLSTDEIDGRGDPTNLPAGFAIAMPSGAAGALALMAGANSAIVGVAIAVALLPPLVNSGMTFAIGLTYYIERDWNHKSPVDYRSQWFSMSGYSFGEGVLHSPPHV